MSLLPVRYPFDITGKSPDNLVVNEIRTLKPTKTRVFSPTHGGFFTKSFVLRDNATGQILRVGDQYRFDNLYEMASIHTKQECAGIVIVTDQNVSNTVSYDYQAIGGLYGYSNEAIVQQLEALKLDERPVEWGSILGRPSEFAPAKHLHDIGDVYGFEYVVHALQQLRYAILTGDEFAHEAIYKYIDKLISESKLNLDALVAAFNRHASDMKNPHGTTAAQVGAYTKAEVETRINDLIRTTLNYNAATRKIGGNVLPISTTSGNQIRVDASGLYVPQMTTSLQPAFDLANQLNTERVADITRLTNALNALTNNVYTKTQTDQKFTTFAANYYTKANIDSILLNYYTKSQVDSTLGNYFTKAQINSTLTGYYTKANIDTKFADYFTKSQINTTLSGYYTKTQVDSTFRNYYNKSEIDTRLGNYYTKAQVDSTLNNYYNKTQADARTNAIITSSLGWSSTKPTINSSVVPLSTSSGNLLTKDATGLYYGIEAPAETVHLFVDAVNGVDDEVTSSNSRGTRDKPLRTLAFALSQGPGGVNRTIFLMEKQIHFVGRRLTKWNAPYTSHSNMNNAFTYTQETGILRGGDITIHPYGPTIDSLPYRAGWPERLFSEQLFNQANTQLVFDGLVVTNAQGGTTAGGFNVRNFALEAQQPTKLNFIGLTLYQRNFASFTNAENLAYEQMHTDPGIKLISNVGIINQWSKQTDVVINYCRIATDRTDFKYGPSVNITARSSMFQFLDRASYHTLNIVNTYGTNPWISSMDGSRKLIWCADSVLGRIVVEDKTLMDHSWLNTLAIGADQYSFKGYHQYDTNIVPPLPYNIYVNSTDNLVYVDIWSSPENRVVTRRIDN